MEALQSPAGRSTSSPPSPVPTNQERPSLSSPDPVDPPVSRGPAEAHLRQMAYMRFTVEMRKGSFLERVRLLLRVPSPIRW